MAKLIAFEIVIHTIKLLEKKKNTEYLLRYVKNPKCYSEIRVGFGFLDKIRRSIV